MAAGATAQLISICMDGGTQTPYTPDSAYVYGTSGKAVFARFVAQEGQTSGALTVYFYTTTITGTPTYKCELRNGPASGNDADRPEAGGAQLAVTADVTPVTNSWNAFTFSGVTLVEGQQYYLICYNTHATPASNNAAFVYRGACDSHGMLSTSTLVPPVFGGYTADGFTTDPTVASTNVGPVVIKYASGTIIGFPYVTLDSAHASNANHRGGRFSFPCAMKVFGHSIGSTSAAARDARIYQGAAQIKSVAFDEWAKQKSGGAFYSDVQLTAATDYDIVISPGTSTTQGTIYTMGMASPPADVLAAKPQCYLGYVDGATPGSLTLDATKAMAQFVFFKFAAGAGGATGPQVLKPIGGGMIYT